MNNYNYDYLIVGAGLFGCVFANQMKKYGYKCLIIDQRSHIGGNVYTEKIEDINVHKYGAHIFHTNDDRIWKFVNEFAEFNRYTNEPVANFKGKLYNLPFNMNTFYQLWGVTTPSEAKRIIDKQILEFGVEKPTNLEETAISLVGKDIYEILIKGYTEKQWGRSAKDLPSFIIKRLPIRYTFCNNYFSDKYQGIPIGGYTSMIENMIEGIEVKLGQNFFDDIHYYKSVANKIVYTGKIDEYYKFCFGHLQYRSLDFETKIIDESNFQGNAVINYTDSSIPFTRIIEHKHFEFGTQKKSVVTYEYPKEWQPGTEPYYPINDDKNMKVYKKYKELADSESNIIFGGRLAEYRYYDMHQIIGSALISAEKEFKSKMFV